MGSRFQPGSPESSDGWTGEPGGSAPAAPAGAPAAPSPGAAERSSPYSPGSGPPLPNAPGPAPAPWASAPAPRRPRRSRAGRNAGLILAALLIVVAVLIAFCSHPRDAAPSGTDPATTDPSAGVSTPGPRRSLTPSSAPSPSSLRGNIAGDQAAPELLGAGAPPPGAGFSPSSPADSDAWTVRFPDYTEGQDSELVFSHLQDGSSAVPSYQQDDLYADEAWWALTVHITPHGYGADDYAGRFDIRLQGRSGRWYAGETVDYQESTVERTEVYVFAVPDWDRPDDPIIEVAPSGSYQGTTPVYIDVG